MGDVLLLNADYRPRQVINWQKAIEYVLRDVVIVLESHEDWEVHSQKLTLSVPSVMVLKRYAHKFRRVSFNRTNVFIRDDFSCQYCLRSVRDRKLKVSDLTYDHVIPRSKGGTTQWTNIVTACGACNRRKADMSLKQSGLTLRAMPFEPQTLNDVEFRLQLQESLPEAWTPYISWAKAS